MTAEELEAFRDRFNVIMKGSKDLRVNRLRTLKRDLKESYNIPDVFRTKQFDSFYEANEEVARLYLQIAVVTR